MWWLKRDTTEAINLQILKKKLEESSASKQNIFSWAFSFPLKRTAYKKYNTCTAQSSLGWGRWSMAYEEERYITKQYTKYIHIKWVL